MSDRKAKAMRILSKRSPRPPTAVKDTEPQATVVRRPNGVKVVKARPKL